MKNRFWAVMFKGYKFDRKGNIFCTGYDFCFTWDKKHSKNKRKEKSVLVWAIYPRKKDAISDAKFRRDSIVKEIFIRP